MASMDMTILGCSGSLAAPDNAASGYLLRMADGRQILMDVGAGVLARLEALGEPGEVDVIFSHLHPDHCSDFGSLVVWQRFHPTSPARHRHILLGPSISAVHLGRAGADHPDLVEDYSDILEIGTWQAPDAEAVPVAFSDESRGTVYPEHRIGETRLYAAPAVHPTESYMIRVEAADGTSLVYSGDTAATGHLAALATGADVLLLGGGVSANRRLRALAAQRCAAAGVSLVVPALPLCTDNGVMIATLAARLIDAGADASPLAVATDPSMDVEVPLLADAAVEG